MAVVFIGIGMGIRIGIRVEVQFVKELTLATGILREESNSLSQQQYLVEY